MRRFTRSLVMATADHRDTTRVRGEFQSHHDVVAQHRPRTYMKPLAVLQRVVLAPAGKLPDKAVVPSTAVEPRFSYSSFHYGSSMHRAAVSNIS